MNDAKLRGRRIHHSTAALNLKMPFEKLESFITRVELFMPRILTPGSGFYEPTNMCDKRLGFKSFNKQTNKIGL